MTRYLFGFLCVCALGVMPLVGCSETTGDGGSGGAAGDGGSGGTAGDGGSGGTILCDDNSDCFSSNDCIKRVCANGMCVDGNEPRDKRCDLGDGVHHGVCDDAGTCVECNVDEQCDDFNDCTSGICESADAVCDHAPVVDGTPCAGGTCQAGQCALTDTLLPCTEQSIRNAIAAGGDEPYTFDCDRPTTVFAKWEIVIDNDVILDGEGNLTVDGSRMEYVPGGLEFPETVFRVESVAELLGFGVSESPGRGILNDGTLRITNSVVSGNSGSGIVGGGPLTITNSTLSGNSENGIVVGDGPLTITNSTLSGNSGHAISVPACAWLGCPPPEPASIEITHSLIDGDCTRGDQSDATWTSNGYNIESPGNTCGLDPEGTDQVNVSAEDLNLGPLAENGGPTMTHALEAGSVAIDQIPEADCQVGEDQRGLPRPVVIVGPESCDVGSVEVQP